MSEQSAAWEYKEESPLREAWKMYLQNRAAVLGLVLLGAVLLLTCVGPLVYPVDPFEMVAPPMSAPGEYGLICGSDYLGRDIFAGIIARGQGHHGGGRLRHAGDAVHRHYHRGAGRIPAGHLGRTAHAGHGILSGVASPSACDGCGGPVQPLADQRGRIHRHCELAAGRPASPAPNSCGSRKWTTWPPRGRWARETPPSCAGSSCPTPSRRWSSWPP